MPRSPVERSTADRSLPSGTTLGKRDRLFRLSLVAAIVFSLVAGSPAIASQWVTDHAVLPPESEERPDGLRLIAGIAYRPDLALQDGLIEFTLGPPGGGFAGVAFRMNSPADYDILYFRPSDDGSRWKNLQYQPVFQGETTWQLYSGSGYEAEIPKSGSPSIHVRLAISGQRADVFVDEVVSPVARLRLERPANAGAVGFWVASPSNTKIPTELRDLKVDAHARYEFAENPSPSLSPGQIVKWRLSPRFSSVGMIRPPAVLSSKLLVAVPRWRIVDADRSGLVNLTREIGNPAGPQSANVFGGAGWGVAYAHQTIMSSAARSIRLAVSYSDGAGIYLNGRCLFIGDNGFDSRYPGYLGIVGKEVDGVMLPLRRGSNDLIIAITDKAFGWGFRARLDSIDGLTIAP